MTSKLIEETVVLPKKDRVKETINASLEDVKKLYKITILTKISFHFKKKLFKKEKEFTQEAHEMHQKAMKSLKCEWTMSYINYGVSDFAIYTIDNIPIELKSVLKSIGQGECNDEFDEMRKLCFKYDRGRMFEIIPVFEKIVEDYWLHN
jgi:hypothetical protein